MPLSVWQRNIVTEAGDVIPDAEIEVFDAGSSSKPDLFSDPDGNSSITNPFNADSNGFARFYVAGGRYDIAVNGAVLWEDVALGTAQRRDTGSAPSEVPTNDDVFENTGFGQDELTFSRFEEEDWNELPLNNRAFWGDFTAPNSPPFSDISNPFGIQIDAGGGRKLQIVGRNSLLAFRSTSDNFASDPWQLVDGVEEFGENSNGSFVRFYDGRQICISNEFEITGAKLERESGIYRSSADQRKTWDYPADFSSTPWVNASAAAGFDDRGDVPQYTVDDATIGLLSIEGEGTTTRNVYVVAIGYWK